MTKMSWTDLDSNIQRPSPEIPAEAGLSPLPEPKTDAKLIAETIAGNREAFVALVRPYLHLFTIGIHRILQNPLDTKDALQEALLRIHSELHPFKGKAKFPPWAYHICLDEGLVLRRARMRRREIQTSGFQHGHLIENELLGHINPCSWAEEYYGFQELDPKDFLGKGANELAPPSDDQRVVFILRVLEGMGTEDVARRLRITQAMVRQHLWQARLSLRDVLSESFWQEVMA